MKENLNIWEILEPVRKNRARVCCICRKDIKNSSDSVFKAIIANHYSQTSERYVCDECAKTWIRKELRAIPSKKKNLQKEIKKLSEKETRLLVFKNLF